MESLGPKGAHMTIRRDVLALAILGGVAILVSPRAGLAAGDGPPAAKSEAVVATLIERYVAAVNAHDTSSFPELFTESYIQHSGRSPSGLAAQIENFRGLFAAFPDVRMQVEDRIIAGDKVAARNTYSATDTQTVGGVAPTGKPFTFRTIDIWRVENGKLAEHWDLTERVEVLRKLRGNQ
jgi:predicted ester cyclase